MTSDYYFRKWKKTLKTLKNLVELDTEYQISKAHDQQTCGAAQRLNGVLGNYIVSYNEALECLQHNLQIQKTEYIYNIVKTIEARILELKGQLRKLEGCYCQFLTNGLIEHKITPHETEFSNISLKYERPENIKMLIDEALQKAKEIKENDQHNIGDKENVMPEDEFLQNCNWWEDQSEVKDEQPKGMNITAIYEVKKVISEETLKRKELISLIQAHELTRQVTRRNLYQAQKREMWEKELKGTLNPAAPLSLREKSAKLIQRVVRHYFEIKRKRIRDCLLDEKLNLNTCNNPTIGNILKDNEKKSRYIELYKKYEIQWKEDCHKYKQSYLKRKRGDISEDYRSYVRDWLRLWYKEARFFYDIPKENRGGIVSIIKEEVPSPSEWLNKYEAYLEMKKANKNKTPYQLKIEQREAKEEEAMLKREELQKKKLEKELLRKIMKNPTLHPGYLYPMSKKTPNILVALEQYFKSWNDLDNEETLSVKEKYVKIVDEKRLCMEAKMEVCKSVNDDMRTEIKTLKKALKDEFLRNGEQMPEQMKKTTQKAKIPRKLKIKQTDENIYDKLTDLAVRGHLKEYPLTNFKDFLGDLNYAGADLRCTLQQTLHFGGESRDLWWERCRDVIHGFKRVLLVGPKQSGKSTLVYAMATVNDAALYELNPTQIEIENLNVEYLQQLVNSITTCAKVTQPSIIYIKYIHKLYYTKVPQEEAFRNFDLIKRFFIRKLFKKINKHDKITIVGSCIDPWLTKSKQMVTKFSNVLLLPETNYSATYLILRNWMLNNRVVPRDLNIEALAYVLQGYYFGYLNKTLDDFLTADQIVKIAAYGLKIQDIYNHIIEDEGEDKIDYNKYVKWYTEKTHWGKLEKKSLEEKIEFKLLVQKWQEKMKKNKQKIRP